MQPRLAVGLSAATLLVLAVPALAWTVGGSGSGAASAAVLSAPGAPVPGTVTADSVSLSWTPTTLGAADVTYLVERTRSGQSTWTAVCGSAAGAGLSATSCTDSSVSSTTAYRYRATARVQGWRRTGADSAVITTTATLAVTTADLPAGTVGTAYSEPLTASGGTTPYTWTLGSGALPAGLSLSPAGLISGTPTTPATATFTVRVSDGSASAQRQLSIVVSPAGSAVPATPAAPVLPAASDSGSSAGDRITNIDRPTVTGAGVTPGATVHVFLDGASTAAGSTTASASGAYSFQFPTALPDGARSIAATQTVGGTSSPRSAALVVTVDTVAPAAPVITAPAQGATGVDRGTAFSGTAGEAGGSVIVTITTNGAATGKTAAAVPGGSNPFAWTSARMQGNTQLAPNQPQSATATHTDVAGNISAHSAARTFGT